jgi:O-antigen ligase
MLLYLGFAFSAKNETTGRILFHPITLLLLLHLLWTYVSTALSEVPIVSVKFSLAKTWYIITFFFLTATVLNQVKDVKRFFWCLFIPLIFTILYTLFRHWEFNFSFDTVNEVMFPFFRNHVNYAVMLGLTVPFAAIAISWLKKGSVKRKLMWLLFLILLVAIYFAYTRAVWVALVIALFAVPLVRRGWLKYCLLISLAAITGFFIYMGIHDQYLEYTPEYETTIYHGELEEHLKATFEGKDVSSAERIYRWVAGVRMWLDDPLTGYGPGNFYDFYKRYTVTAFTTYVSANPEKSTVHNYFLQMMIDQGIIGFLIFLSLYVVTLFTAEKVYRRTIEKNERIVMMAVILCLLILLVNLMLNDLIETDKAGSFFFICLAWIVNQDMRNKKRLNENPPAPTNV